MFPRLKLPNEAKGLRRTERVVMVSWNAACTRTHTRTNRNTFVICYFCHFHFLSSLSPSHDLIFSRVYIFFLVNFAKQQEKQHLKWRQRCSSILFLSRQTQYWRCLNTGMETKPVYGWNGRLQLGHLSSPEKGCKFPRWSGCSVPTAADCSQGR